MIRFKREEIENMSDESVLELFMITSNRLKEKLNTFPFIITDIHDIKRLKEKLDVCVEEITKRAI